VAQLIFETTWGLPIALSRGLSTRQEAVYRHTSEVICKGSLRLEISLYFAQACFRPGRSLDEADVATNDVQCCAKNDIQTPFDWETLVLKLTIICLVCSEYDCNGPVPSPPPPLVRFHTISRRWADLSSYDSFGALLRDRGLVGYG